MDISLKDNDIAESRAWAKKKLWMEILVALTAPLVFLFVPRRWDRMPDKGPLRLYQCWLYGINGDPYWQAAHGDSARGYFRRVAWCWRNANVLDYERGVSPADIVKIEHFGPPGVGNRPLVEGDLAIHAWTKDGRRVWEYYTVKKSLIFSGRCYRARIGWKLKDVLDEYLKDGVLNNDPSQREVVPTVYSVNPLMGYSE